MVRQVELSCGVIEYSDSGGDLPPIVLLHGLAMNHTLWDGVVRYLKDRHRCIAPTLPKGGHRIPVRCDFSLSLARVSSLIGEFLEALDLQDVTLVENDSGRAQTFAATNPPRLKRLVLVACEAFDNFPPGLPGKMIGLVSRIPGGIWAASRLVKIKRLRSLPIFFGRMSVRPIPTVLTDDWLRPLIENGDVRRDFRQYCRSATRGSMVSAAEGLRGCKLPTLVVWAAQDRVMPKEHGRKLAALIPDASFVEIQDSGTLIPLDQPKVLAEQIARFARAAAA